MMKHAFGVSSLGSYHSPALHQRVIEGFSRMGVMAGNSERHAYFSALMDAGCAACSN
jgi:hypothetical protein